MGLLHLLLLLSSSSMVLLEELQLPDVLPLDPHPDERSMRAELHVEESREEGWSSECGEAEEQQSDSRRHHNNTTRLNGSRRRLAAASACGLRDRGPGSEGPGSRF